MLRLKDAASTSALVCVKLEEAAVLPVCVSVDLSAGRLYPPSSPRFCCRRHVFGIQAGRGVGESGRKNTKNSQANPWNLTLRYLMGRVKLTIEITGGHPRYGSWGLFWFWYFGVLTGHFNMFSFDSNLNNYPYTGLNFKRSSEATFVGCFNSDVSQVTDTPSLPLQLHRWRHLAERLTWLMKTSICLARRLQDSSQYCAIFVE